MEGLGGGAGLYILPQNFLCSQDLLCSEICADPLPIHPVFSHWKRAPGLYASRAYLTCLARGHCPCVLLTQEWLRPAVCEAWGTESLQGGQSSGMHSASSIGQEGKLHLQPMCGFLLPRVVGEGLTGHKAKWDTVTGPLSLPDGALLTPPSHVPSPALTVTLCCFWFLPGYSTPGHQ